MPHRSSLLLTTSEAAKRAGVCQRTLLRWLTSARLEGSQTAGGHWRIEESSLERFLTRDASRASSPLRVLIVEDDHQHARALARLVSLFVSGADVAFAEDGLTAGLRLGHAPPDLAFVDIEMAGLDGIEVVRRARELPALDDVHFVVVSGRLTPERVRTLGALGVRDILSKPLAPEALRRILDARISARAVRS